MVSHRGQSEVDKGHHSQVWEVSVGRSGRMGHRLEGLWAAAQGTRHSGSLGARGILAWAAVLCFPCGEQEGQPARPQDSRPSPQLLTLRLLPSPPLTLCLLTSLTVAPGLPSLCGSGTGLVCVSDDGPKPDPSSGGPPVRGGSCTPCCGRWGGPGGRIR